MLFNVVLIEPEIPQNTGNIGRTCVATQSRLHLVGKMGFEINDRNLRRAGLDYWQHLTWGQFSTYEDWQKTISQPERVFYLTTKVTKTIYDIAFQPGDTFVFGKETKGLDSSILSANAERCLTIPQFGPVRSLNVATAVSIVLYEGIRQLRLQGKLEVKDRKE